MKDFITREELTQALEQHFTPGKHDATWASRTAGILFDLAGENKAAIKRFTEEEVAYWLIRHGDSLGELRAKITELQTEMCADISTQAQEIENVRAEIAELRGWFGQALLEQAQQMEWGVLTQVPDDDKST